RSLMGASMARGATRSGRRIRSNAPYVGTAAATYCRTGHLLPKPRHETQTPSFLSQGSGSTDSPRGRDGRPEGGTATGGVGVPTGDGRGRHSPRPATGGGRLISGGAVWHTVGLAGAPHTWRGMAGSGLVLALVVLAEAGGAVVGAVVVARAAVDLVLTLA